MTNIRRTSYGSRFSFGDGRTHRLSAATPRCGVERLMVALTAQYAYGELVVDLAFQ